MSRCLGESIWNIVSRSLLIFSRLGMGVTRAFASTASSSTTPWFMRSERAESINREIEIDVEREKESEREREIDGEREKEGERERER